MKDVSYWFRKRPINDYSAIEFREGKMVPRLYRREDLSKWAEEAYNKGQFCFYAKPINPNEPYGKLELCEPEYEYALIQSLTQEEMNEMFGEEVYIKPKNS